MILRALLVVLVMLAAPVAALDLALPSNARLTVERDTKVDVYRAPVSVFAQGQVARVNIEGAVRRAAWRLESPGLTPLQVMRPLRDQLRAAGFDIVLDCAAKACGGFDFRFATETLPGPNMYVNIRAYHVVTAFRPAGAVPQEVVNVLTSTSATSAYVQIIQAGALKGGGAVVSAPADDPQTGDVPEVQTGDLGARLLRDGHLVLGDLDFETGSSELGAGPFATLGALSEFLKSRSGLRVALVGHTDSVGGLAGNIALSKRRAQSVRRRLIEVYGIAAAQMEAEGMGYLSPVASNLEEAGRDANRRVEVVVLSTQ